MATIHEKIDELLAADLHDELSAAERDALHTHLVECAECRQAFQEEKNMDKLLNETIADKKADAAFEQRMVSRFRDRVPKRSGLISMVADLLRVRAVQLTAVAALLLALAQMGKMITGESVTQSERNEDISNIVEAALHKPGASRESGLLSKTDGRSKGADLAAQTAPPPPPAQDKPQTESPLPVTVYSAEVKNRQASTAPKTKKSEAQDESTPNEKEDAA